MVSDEMWRAELTFENVTGEAIPQELNWHWTQSGRVPFLLLAEGLGDDGWMTTTEMTREQAEALHCWLGFVLSMPKPDAEP